MTTKPKNQTHSRIFTSSPSLSHSNVWWLLHHSTTETSLAFCAVIRSSDVNNAVYCVAVAYSSFTKRHVVEQVVCTDVKVGAEPTAPRSINKWFRAGNCDLSLSTIEKR